MTQFFNKVFPNFVFTLDDVQILSETYLLDKTTAEYNNQNNRKLRNVHLMYDDSKSDTTKGSIRSAYTTDTDLSSSSPNSTILSSASTTSSEKQSRRESGLFNKCTYNDERARCSHVSDDVLLVLLSLRLFSCEFCNTSSTI